MPQRKPQAVETVNLDRLNKDWSTYREPTGKHRWVREYLKMTRHTQGHVDPIIIGARRPNEDPRVHRYRVSQFRAITKSPLNRAINSLQRIFNNSSVSVTWPEATKGYFDELKFDDCTFMGFIITRVVRRMIEDANGLLLWWAEVPETRNVRAEPRPILVLTENVVHLEEDLLIVDTEEKSDVQVYQNGQWVNKKDGQVWLVVTKHGYYKREQYGRRGKNLYRIVNGYAHQLGYLPFVTLGGEEQIAHRKGSNMDDRWLASYFEPCTPYADEALHQFSDWQGVMVMSAGPLREVEPMKCPNPDCRKGKIITLVGEKEKRNPCPVCKGTMFVDPVGPYGKINRKTKRAGVGEEAMADPVPAVRFIHPDPAILEQIEKAWRELMKDVERALQLLFIEEAQSGVAKDKDREDKVSTLDRIGGNVFDVLVVNSAQICLGILGITGQVKVTKPATFVVRTEVEIREELKELTGDGAQPLYKAEAFKELIRKRFPGNLVLHKIVDALVYFDPSVGYNAGEKASMVASGVFSDEMVRRGALAAWVLQSIATDKGVDAFLAMSLADLKKEAIKIIDKELAANPVIPPQPEPVPPNARR